MILCIYISFSSLTYFLRSVLFFFSVYSCRVAIKPWIDQKTVSKFIFVNSMEALDKELVELTARKKLFPKEYGGEIEDIDSTPAPGF